MVDGIVFSGLKALISTITFAGAIGERSTRMSARIFL